MYIMINNCDNVDGWKLKPPILIHDFAPFIAGISRGINSKITITINPFFSTLLSLKTSNGIATEKNKNAK